MKLRPRTFQIFWDAHAWAGVVASLLLYVMFFMGAFALFYPEINVWAEPSAGRAALAAPAARVPLTPLLEQLERERHVLGAERVAFMPNPTGLHAYIKRDGEYTELRYDAGSGRMQAARSDIGSFLYSLHYLGPIPYGIWVAGFASMALLLALISGLLIHLKDLVRQWFQFRPERVLRTWTSDVHKVLGVFGLPYQLMYAWTGAVLALAYLVVEPVFERVVFDGQSAAVAAARGESGTPLPEPTGKIVGLPDLDRCVALAEQRVPGMRPNWIGVEHVGDEGSTVGIYADMDGAAFGSAEVVLRASDGQVLGASALGEANGYRRFAAWFYGLHYARFGGYAVKLLYALLAFGTCAVIASGNLVWLERRDHARASAGNRLLERLTVGFCAGVIPATACALLGSRLLPLDLPGRTGAEQWVFWLSWLPLLVAPFLWPRLRRVASLELLLGSLLFAACVALDLLGPAGAFAGPVQRSVLSGLAVLGFASGLGSASLWRPRGPERAKARPGSSREPSLSEPDTAHHEPG